MKALLDVNVLIALIDTRHARHDDAHDWFGANREQGWATCPLTENGLVRVLGLPRYPDPPGSIETIANLLVLLTESPDHEFWPDDISLLEERRFVRSRLGPSARLTDSYLLALAVRRSGLFVTFDRRVATDAVVGGASALVVI